MYTLLEIESMVNFQIDIWYSNDLKFLSHEYLKPIGYIYKSNYFVDSSKYFSS